MAIAFVAASAYASGASNVVISKPAGTANGNLLIAFVAVQDTGGTTRSSVNTLAGWTAIVNATSATNGGSFTNIYAFWKVAASEPSTYTWVGTAGSGATISGFDGMIRTYSGTATSSPINFSAAAPIPGGGNVTIPTFVGSETFVSGEWYVACCADSSNALPSATNPVLGNIASNAGVFDSFYNADYVPSSAPVAEVFTMADGTGTGVGLTILPPGGGGGATFALAGQSLIFM
jgi:hypothetical protein